jgi:hypothetical protein
MRQKNLLAIFLWGAFFLLIYVPVGYSQQTQKEVEPSLSPQVPQKVPKEQTQKKVEPSLSPQVPPKVLKQQSPASQEQKGEPTRPKRALPDLTVVGSLRVARGPETGEVAGGPHGGERWFSVLLYFDVENRGMAPAGRFENYLVSEGSIGMQSAGRGIKNSLGPHERKTYNASFLIPLEYAGRTVRIRAYVDPLNETIESDETNNSSDWFEVRLPSLPSLPDLKVTIDRIEETGWTPDIAPTYLGFYKLTFTVRNIGIASSRYVEWQIDFLNHRGEWEGNATGGTHTIAPGGSFTHRLSGLQVLEEATKVRVTLDPENWEEELDESNNQAEKNMPSLPTGRPVLVADLSVTIDSIVQTGRSEGGDGIYTISFTVRNNGTGWNDINEWQIQYFDGGTWYPLRHHILPVVTASHPFSRTESNLTIPDRATKVRVVVDPDDIVPESDESNNQAEKNMPLRLAPHLPEEEIRR